MKNQSQRTILLVEDEPLTALAEAIKLKEYGYKVIHAHDGLEAIETVSVNKSIDLILMDINLGMAIDGTETAKRILKNHDIPVLFLSSHTEREIVEKTENITSYGYVIKDSGITVLDASIKMAFKLHEACNDLAVQKKKIEEKENELKFYEKRYRRLFESAKDGILILNFDDGMIVDVNPFLIELLGYSKNEFLMKKIWEIGAFKNIDYSKHLYKELQDKDYIRYLDLPLETYNGKLIHVEFVSNVYMVDNEKVIQCNIRDITDRLKLEKKLTENIDKKEALLQELQHRTKNSLHMITSLIRLRADITQSVETKNVLDELTYRVKSISDLFTLLYETNSYYEVDLKIYCGKVIESMLDLSKNIEFIISIANITVSTQKAAALGMILVELITNAVKYAFPDSQKGIIKIYLKKIKNKKLSLIVEDNGIGLQKDFDITKIKSIGIHLVDLMVNQLKGNIKFIVENGTKVTIECPV